MKHGQRSRITVVGALAAAAALVLAGCSGGGGGGSDEGAADSGGELRKIQISAPASYNALTLHVADQEGYFAEAGLEIEIVPTVGAEAVPQLLGGSLQFMLADMVTLVRAQSEGVPLAVAAPNVLLDPPGDTAYTNILMRTEDADKYDSPADISGKVFGIPTIGSQPWLDVRTLVAEAGGDPETIEFVEVPNPLQALRQKQVDFVTAPEPMGTAGVLEGDIQFLTPITQQVLGGALGYPYLTTTDLWESDPELVEAFRGAVIKANKLINSDRERAIEVAASYLDVPLEVIEASTLPLLGEEMPSTEELQATIDRIVTAGLIPADKAPEPKSLLAQ